MPTQPIKAEKTAKEVLAEQQQDPNAKAVDPALAQAREIAKKHKAEPVVHRGNPDLRPPDQDSHIIQLKDGRKILMAEPSVPTDLVVPKMFGERDRMDLQARNDIQIAEVLQYVRSIDNERLPSPISTWRECVDIMHRLGDRGVKAVKDAYVVYYGNDAELWIEVKN